MPTELSVPLAAWTEDLGHVASESGRWTAKKAAQQRSQTRAGTEHVGRRALLDEGLSRSYMCGDILSKENSGCQGPEAEQSWESKGSGARRGQEKQAPEPEPAGFQAG